MRTLQIFLLIVIASSSVQGQSTLPGLVAWWQLDSSLSDASGNGFTGTAMNATPFATDRHGSASKAVFFNGTNQFLRFGDILDSVFCRNPIAQFTVSCWTKIGGFPNGGYRSVVVGKSAGGSGPYQWYLLCDPDQKFRAAVSSSVMGPVNWVENQSSGQLQTNTWYHVALVFDGALSTVNDRIKVYVNGVAGTTSATNGSLGTTTSNTSQEITIGAGHAGSNASTPNNQYSGLVDDVQIYNRALSPAEIMQLTNSTESIPEEPETQLVTLVGSNLSDDGHFDFFVTKAAAYSVVDKCGRIISNGIVDESLKLSIPTAGMYFIRFTSIDDRQWHSIKVITR